MAGLPRDPAVACPACARPFPERVDYPEGAVYICSGCRLQWSADAAKARGFVPTGNFHYHDPASLGDPGAYPPYTDFFARAGALLGPGPWRILDVGCGSGAFLAECLRRGHQARGVEPDTSLSAFMTPEVRRVVEFSRAEDMVSPGGPYDCVTFWDSFEHMEGAFDLLDSLRTCLRPGGVAYLRVNNNRDIYNAVSLMLARLDLPLGRRLFKACFNFPGHAWNFSRQGMERLLAARGWRVADAVVGETPASRITGNAFFALAINAAYLVNRALGGGKIGNYYVRPSNG